MAMKLYIDKDKCEISETLNGKMVIEINEDIYVENSRGGWLLDSGDDSYISTNPYTVRCPKDYKL